MQILNAFGLENTFLNMFGLLVFVHLLMDYPLQGDFMSKAKNRTSPFPGVPWRTILISHSFMHGFAVYLITGSAVLLIIETHCHYLIDQDKCLNKISFNTDQFLHIFMKLIYAVVLINNDVIVKFLSQY